MGLRIYWLYSLNGSKTPTMMIGYKTESDSNAPHMEIRWVQSIPSSLLLPGPLRELAHVKFLSIDQIDLFKIIRIR